MHRAKKLCCLVFSLSLFALPVHAAQSGGTADGGSSHVLVVTATGPNGYALPDAIVVLRDSAGAEVVRASADSSGTVRARSLVPGGYTLEVAATGFATATRDLVVADRAMNVAVALQIAGIHETVTVSERVRIDLQGVPGSVALVSGEAISDSVAHNLKDVLDFVPGVVAQPRFGADESKLSVRGSGLRNNFHHRGMNLLVNGIPYTDADGFSDFESIDLMATESITVWKGANALRYGGNSMGGAINFETHTGYTAEPLQIWLQGGSFGLFKGQVSAGGVGGDVDWYVSFSDTELDGYRDHADQARRRLSANVGHDISDATNLRLDVMYADVSELLPGALTRAQFDQDPRGAQGINVIDDYGRFYDYVRVGGKVRHEIDQNQEISFSAFGDYRDMVHPIFQVLDNSTTTFGGDVVYRWRGDLAGNTSRLTLGFAPLVGGTDEQRFENAGGTSGQLLSEFENDARNYGLWFEGEIDLTETFTFIAGGRADWAHRSFADMFLADGDRSDERTYEAFVPKVGFLWQARPALQVFGNVSRSYEPPLLLELTSFGDPGFLDLDAQDTWQIEVGTRGRLSRAFHWDIALFDAEIDNEIINVNLQPFPFAPFTIPSYRNAASTRHLGLELGTTVVIDGGALANRGAIAWRTAYTWSEFAYVDDPTFGDNDLPGAPRHVLRTEWRYDDQRGFWVAPGLDLSLADYFVDSANTEVNEAYAVLNVKAGHDLGPFEAFLHLNNVTDATYAASVQVDNDLRRFLEAGNGFSAIAGLRWKMR